MLRSGSKGMFSHETSDQEAPTFSPKNTLNSLQPIFDKYLLHPNKPIPKIQNFVLVYLRVVLNRKGMCLKSTSASHWPKIFSLCFLICQEITTENI